MRTTVDLPDELFRKAKSEAALRGVSLKTLIIEAIEAALAPPEKFGHDGPFPGGDLKLPAEYFSLTNAQIEELLIKEDLEKYGF